MQEDLSQGERIRAYRIEAKVDGRWKTVAQGTAVGNKRIERFEPVQASALRVRVEESIGEPVISNFSAFCVAE